MEAVDKTQVNIAYFVELAEAIVLDAINNGTGALNEIRPELGVQEAIPNLALDKLRKHLKV